MPFGNKQDPKETIKEAFGMEADEIKSKLAELETLKTTIEEVKTLASAQTGTLTEIKESIGKMSTPYGGGGGGRTEDKKTTEIKELARWDEDADKAYNDRIAPIIGGVLDTRGMIAKREAMDEVNTKNPDLPWMLFADEINEKAKNSSLESRANPEFWKNVYYVCVGEKRKQIETDRNAKSGKFFTESASSSIVVTEEDKTKPEDKLTSAQLDAARKSGLSPAEYAKELASMSVWR